MSGFYFDGGPADAREKEKKQTIRYANQNFNFYEIYVPVYKPGPDQSACQLKQYQTKTTRTAKKTSKVVYEAPEVKKVLNEIDKKAQTLSGDSCSNLDEK